MSRVTPVRIGVLGAARIAPMALVRPARTVMSARVAAVAARDRSRADAFAKKQGIPRVHDSYDDLLADPDIDAIYNPLPNGLHCEWTVRALEAGKHVLCEKPIAANATEAEQMADAAEAAGRCLAEAFHWRYHPLAARMREVVTSGELGKIRRVETHFCLPLALPGDIRYRLDLAGGATMDVGSYTVSILRFLAGAEPEKVTHADFRESSPGVDRYMSADLRFPDGVSGHVTHSLFSSILLRARASVIGDEGEMHVLNPIAPHFFNRLTVRGPNGQRRESVSGDATYVHQLRAFCDWVQGGKPMPTDGRNGVRNMRVIDSIYDAAGLPRRGVP